MMRRSSAFALLCVLSLSAVSGAADPALVEALAKPILDENTSQQDVEAFCATRVLPLVQPTSADEWKKTADKLRKDTLERVVLRGEAARWKELPLRIDWLEEIDGGPGYQIKKLRYEVLPGLWIPALLYVPDKLEVTAEFR